MIYNDVLNWSNFSHFIKPFVDEMEDCWGCVFFERSPCACAEHVCSSSRSGDANHMVEPGMPKCISNLLVIISVCYSSVSPNTEKLFHGFNVCYFS